MSGTDPASTPLVSRFGLDDNRRPWAERTVEEILDEVDDPVARQYLTITIHSDLATEPHLTNGLIGLRNFLKSVPGYGAQYRIEGGMELLPRRLADRLTATDVRLNAPVVGVSGRPDGRYGVAVRLGRQTVPTISMPSSWRCPYNLLRTIEWTGERLRRAVTRHVARYDRPGRVVEARVHRWAGALSGTPKGVPRSADIATGLALVQEAAPDVARARCAPGATRHLPPRLTPGASRTSPAMR